MMATTVNDDGLKSGLLASGTLHALLFLFLYFGLPVIFTPPPMHHDPVPFEIVEVADITNTRIKDQDAAQPAPPPPPPKPEPAKPPESQAQPTPPKPQVEALEAMKPAIKPKPPEAVKPKTDEFAKLLKNLEINKKPDTPKTDSKADTKTPTQQAASQAPALSNRLTISQEDLLRRQITQCWNMPIGARDAQSLIVEVAIDVNPDRTVQHAEIVDKSRMATDPFYRAAAEAALRAVYNPKCSPLELPPDQYEQWKHIDFTFDPRDML